MSKVKGESLATTKWDDETSDHEHIGREAEEATVSPDHLRNFAGYPVASHFRVVVIPEPIPNHICWSGSQTQRLVRFNRGYLKPIAKDDRETCADAHACFF